MEFRTPTPLNSTDLQCGQRFENMELGFRGRCIAGRGGGAVPEWIGAAAGDEAAGFAGSLDLFFRPQVRLGQFYSFSGPGHFTFMYFC